VGLGKHLKASGRALDGRRRARTSSIGTTTPVDGRAKRTTELIDRLASRLVEVEASRLGTKNLHASKIYNICTKQHALARQHGVPLDVLTASQRLRFDIGESIHDYLRDRHLGPLGVLSGNWVCVRCGALVENAFMPPVRPVDRRRCNEHGWRYREPVVRNEQLGLVGHLDGRIWSDAAQSLGVLEIKSKDPALMRTMRRPDPEHEYRTKIYCWLDGRSWGKILYLSTGLDDRPGKIPFREFDVAFDVRIPVLVEKIVADLRSGGTRACSTPEDARALLCPVVRHCFPETRP
jgi:hypothetical protein